MSLKSTRPTPWSVPVPLSPLSIGLWEDDVEADRVRGDAVVARIYGVSEEAFADGITRAHLFSMFHPDDIALDPELRRSVRESGGLFVWEHRILPEPGVVRWVLVRGHFARGANGRMRGRGIIIDMTDARLDGHAEGPARFLTAGDALGSTINRMAEHALQLMDLVGGLDGAGASELRSLIEVLLFEIARQIAASLQSREGAVIPSRPPRDPHLH